MPAMFSHALAFRMRVAQHPVLNANRLRRIGCRIGVVALGASLFAPLVQAQSLHGRILDRGTGQPLPGVVVAVLDARDSAVTVVLTDSLGRYQAQIPRPGRYRLRTDVVGLLSSVSPEIDLGDSQSREFDFAFDRRVSKLPTVSVVGKERCSTKGAAGRVVVALWDEVRKALDATRLTDRAVMRIGLLQYERELDPTTLAVRRSRNWVDAGVGQEAYGSLPAETLAAKGYVQVSPSGTWYYAPDARTLVSGSFLGSHCFSPRLASEGYRGLVGLAFEPIGSRNRTDVRGVLWLDETTSELRHLEYSYTGLPRHLEDRDFGGRIEFARLASGAWVVQRWSIRMPKTVRTTRYRQSPMLELGAPPRLTPISEEVVAAIIERGGELTVHAPEGSSAGISGIAYIRGAVFDSTSLRPLPGADVMVELTDVDGASWHALTDSLGEFRVDKLREGTYVVRAAHPRLDTLGTPSLSMTVSLAADEGVTLALYTRGVAHAAGGEVAGASATADDSLAPASAASVAAAERRGRVGARFTSRLSGTVVGTTGRPISGAEIRILSRDLATRSDDDGRFLLLGVPEGDLVVEARTLGHLPVRRNLAVKNGAPYIVHFRLTMVAQPLDTVQVAGREDRSLTGFAERRRRSMGGHFLTRQMIDASTTRRVSEYLRTVPGLRIRKVGSVSVVELAGRGTRTLSPAGCPVAWVLDGVAYEPASFGIDGEIGLDDIEAIEVYAASTAPIQFSRIGASCGVVMLWTREKSVAR